MTVHRIHSFLIKNTLILVILAAIFFISAAIAVVSFTEGEEQDNAHNPLAGSGLAMVNNRITDLMTGVSTEEARNKAFFEFTENSKLTQEGNNYFLQIEKGRQQINKEYPLLIDNGAFYYLYHSEFILITNSFEKIAATPYTYLSEGKVFNQQKHRDGDKNIILLGLPNGYYMNSQKIDILNGDSIESIEINSIIQFGENQISYCNLHDNKLKLYKIEMTDFMTKVELQDTELSYSAFYNHLVTDNAVASQRIDKVTLSSDIYQYFIETRYEYLGDKNFYYTGQGYFMEHAAERFLLESAPMYFAEGSKLLLPSDYVLVQPSKYQMNKLSAMTEVFFQDEIVYATTGEEKRTFRDIVLFDGQDTYIFFNDTELSWEEESITITPLSSVTVTADGKLEVYNYAAAEYMTYQLGGYQEVLATITGNTKFNLSQDILYRPDGQEQILFSEPSLLRNAE
ncbi:MAG: hypothetical protein K0R00_3261 [Herbinix sp.]|jgi:hypothetical protein|nr:hypothetical protein [Herbinix sp.]